MKKKTKKSFDWKELDEAVGYFVRRFAGEDVKISPCGFGFLVIPGPDDCKTIQYMVLREKNGWNVWDNVWDNVWHRTTSDGDKSLKTFRSYEKAAIFLEKRILAN